MSGLIFSIIAQLIPCCMAD